MKRILSLLLLVLASSFITAHSDSGAVAIVNGKIYTMTGETIERGSVIMENGRITAVGKDVKVPANARRIDAAGKIVMPGMIDASTRMGLQEIGAVEVTNDFDERV